MKTSVCMCVRERDWMSFLSVHRHVRRVYAHAYVIHVHALYFTMCEEGVGGNLWLFNSASLNHPILLLSSVKPNNSSPLTASPVPSLPVWDINLMKNISIHQTSSAVNPQVDNSILAGEHHRSQCFLLIDFTTASTCYFIHVLHICYFFFKHVFTSISMPKRDGVWWNVCFRNAIV